MDTETQQQIKERLESLPLPIQQAISSADVGNKIISIAKKNNLLMDQVDKLYMEVFLAMLGIESFDNLTNNIEKNVGVMPATALAMEKDINDEILIPIRESMGKTSEYAESGDESSNATPSVERDQILSDIENPKPTTPRAAEPIMDPSRELESRSAAEDFVAGKLVAPSVSSAETVTITDAPAEPKKKYAADPYREPIN